MKGGYKKPLNAFSYPTVDAKESSASPGDQANDAINNADAKNLDLINLTEGVVKNIDVNQLGGRRTRKTKKRQTGSGRTINVPKQLPSGKIPEPSFNGGLTIGEKCVGGHCSIPVDPLTSNLTNNNLKSANPPLKGTFHYQGTNRLGNSSLNMPGIDHYTGTTINYGKFNLLTTGGGKKKRQKGGGRTINVPKQLPSGKIPDSSYNSAITIGEPCKGIHCALPVDSTTTNYINNNLKSAKTPQNALNQYQGTNRLGNSNLDMPGVDTYVGTTLNHGPFNILTTGGGSYYLKIVNPDTGRKVSIFGKLGQKILSNYLNQL